MFGTDSFDIALAADGVDICDVPFDGIYRLCSKKLNFDNTFAFHNFNITINPYEYRISDITDPVTHLMNKITISLPI